MPPKICFCCGKTLHMMCALTRVTCADDQTVLVGNECLKHIKKAKFEGYQPPKGGPKLYLMQFKPVL